MKELKDTEVQFNGTADKQISLTDFAAHSMKRRGTCIVGCNVQTAVDARRHLIVAHEVMDIGIDRDQLIPTAEPARAAMGSENLTVIADGRSVAGASEIRCRTYRAHVASRRLNSREPQ